MNINRFARGTPVVTALAAWLVAAGCASPKQGPKPFTPPAARVEVTHFAGTPLSGPTTQPIRAVPADQALAVRVRLVAVEGAPAAGRPLAGTARLITADRLGTPVLPSARLTRGARVVDLRDPADVPAGLGAGAGQTATFFTGEAAVAKGVTAAFVATDPAPLDPQVAGPAAFGRLELYVHRPKTDVAPDAPLPVEVAIVVQGLAPLPVDLDRTAEGPGGGTAAPLPPTSTMQREVAVIDRQVGDRDVVAVVVPFRFAGAAGRAVAAVIDLARDPGSPEHMAAMSRAVDDGRRSAEGASRAPTGLAGGRGESSSVAAALDALAAPARLRPSLVYLAGQTGARLCEDVALVADDGTLAALAEGVRKALAPAQSPATAPSAAAPTAAAAVVAAAARPSADSAAVGWQLDRAAFELLGKLVADNRVPSELAAVLASHTGEAGRHAASFEEVGRGVAGRADFEARLVAENRIYLEDGSPSARVRAYDWLAARNATPPGFDPLGSPRERREAIDRAPAIAPGTSPSAR